MELMSHTLCSFIRNHASSLKSTASPLRQLHVLVLHISLLVMLLYHTISGFEARYLISNTRIYNVCTGILSALASIFPVKRGFYHVSHTQLKDITTKDMEIVETTLKSLSQTFLPGSDSL